MRIFNLIIIFLSFSCITGQIELLPQGGVQVNVDDTPCGTVISEVADLFGIEASYEGANSSQSFKGQASNFSSFLSQYMTGKDFLIQQKENNWRIIENDSTLGEDEVIHYYYVAKNVPPLELVREIQNLELVASILALKHQGSILIKGTYGQVQSAVNLLEAIDNVTNSISVECLVVEYRHQNGYNWGFNIQTGQSGNFDSGSYDAGTDQTSISFGYSATSFLENSFILNIQALVEKNVAKIATNPHITVNNGDSAQINIAQTKYVQLQTASINGLTTQLQEIETGIKLDVSPTMTSDSTIHLHFSGEVSEFLPTSDDATYTIESNTVQTSVDLRSGETLVVGGLIREQKSDYSAGVPFLSRIPLIGLLFKRVNKNKVFVETVIYITARHAKSSVIHDSDHLFYDKLNETPTATEKKKLLKEESDKINE